MLRQKLADLDCQDELLMEFLNCLAAWNNVIESCLGRNLLPNWEHSIDFFRATVPKFMKKTKNIGKSHRKGQTNGNVSGSNYIHCILHHLKPVLMKYQTGLTMIGTDQPIEK